MSPARIDTGSTPTRQWIAGDSVQPLPAMVSYKLRKSGKEVLEKHLFDMSLCCMQELACTHDHTIYSDPSFVNVYYAKQ